MKDSKSEPVKKSPTNLPMFDMFGQNPTFKIYGEDSHGTRFGCILSIIVVLIISALSGFYLYRWLYRWEVNVSAVRIIGQTYDTVNIGAGTDFFMSFVYRGDGGQLRSFNNIEDKFISINVFEVIVDNSDNEDAQLEYTREKVNLESCNEVLNNTSIYRGNSDSYSKNARCLTFEGETILKGKVGDSQYQYLEILVEPCPTTSEECDTSKFQTSDDWTFPRYQNALKRIRELRLQFNFLDASVNGVDVDSPLSYNVNSDHFFMINFNKEINTNFFFGNYTVTTKHGIFYPSASTRASVALMKSIQTSTHRQIGAQVEEFRSPTGDETKTAPYVKINMLASNAQIEVERTYETLLDAFGNIGGVTQAITFIVLLFIFFHTEIRYEQRILNDGLLRERRRKIENQEQRLLNDSTNKGVRISEATVTRIHEVSHLLSEINKINCLHFRCFFRCKN